MAVDEVVVAGLRRKFAVMRKVADERTWRVYLGSEALGLGRGGIKAVAVAAGVSESMVARGVGEIESGAVDEVPPGRSRRPGGGRKRAEEAQPGLSDELRVILQEATRGDPAGVITWCSLSLREIVRRLGGAGFCCGKDAVARMLRELGYSLQAMAKVLEGKKQHPDRDAQFRRIGAAAEQFMAEGEPVVSADGKKKEMLGLYARGGRAWRPCGDPVKARDHDFADKDTVRICPYGICGIAANRGFVSVGTSHETAAFAVNALRLWWQREGSLRYPRARRLLVICDAGGSNSCTGRLHKHEMALLRDQAGLEITVMHFPPGTSKWNKIEHRMFCHVTRTWAARPLLTVADAVAGIAATITAGGLKCTAVTDDACYPKGIEISDTRMKHIEDCDLDRDSFHGEWNYTFRAVPRPAPEPEPPPGRPGRVPAAVLNHPALTGITPQDVTALAKALEVPFAASREQRNYARRGHRRVNAVRNGDGSNGRTRTDLTDRILAWRLREHLRLPCQAIAVMLGIHPSTVSHAAASTARLLAAARIPLPPAAPPPGTLPRTPAQLIAHAAAAGITLTIPDDGQPMPQHFRTRGQNLRHARS